MTYAQLMTSMFLPMITGGLSARIISIRLTEQGQQGHEKTRMAAQQLRQGH